MKIGEYIIDIDEMVYEPSDDTFLLFENLIIKPEENVLEIGTGSGIIAIHASKIAKEVIATDINFNAIELAEKNLIANNIKNVQLVFGNLFEPVKNKKFDTILFNTPYLPTEECEVLEDNLNYAFDGGLDGRKVIDMFLDEVKYHLNDKGKIQMIQSSLADIEKTISKLESLRFKTEIASSEKFFFEEIVLINAYLNK